MELNRVFKLEEYDEAYDFVMKNDLTIKELEIVGDQRLFQIIEKDKLSEEERLNFLRSKREFECFSIINRGRLWYEGITVEQYIELQKWYFEWLDVTKTKNIPVKPDWLK